MNKDDAFLKKLLATFRVEAGEHIAGMSSGLIELEKTSGAEKQMEIIETIFREAHSLKGAARAVNMTEIEAICQSLESVFAALKRKDIVLSPELFDVLHKAVDTLSDFLLSIGAVRTDSEKSLIKELIRRLEGELKEQGSGVRDQVPQTPETRPLTPSMAHSVSDTIRISTSKLDSVLLKAEELLSEKLAASQHVTEIREINTSLEVLKKGWARIHLDMQAIEESFKRNGKSNWQAKKNSQILKLIEFMEWNTDFFKSLQRNFTAMEKSAEHHQRSLGAMVDDLLDDMKKVLMLPFSSLLETFPKLVRDLSHDKGKDAELVIRGGDIEIDRRILEEMKDPLIHLVRNCIDHGIEKPEERARREKLFSGTIKIDISHFNSKKVEILISDDGAGIDPAEIKAVSLKAGVLSQEEAERMNEQDVLSLIFLSGVTTSPIITDISGRGLGLAIVQEKVKKLGGSISCQTNRGAGTTFRIVLPLTLATYRGVLVRIDEHLLIIPTINIDSVKRIRTDEIKTVENKETISFDGRTVSFVPLDAVLELPQKEKIGQSAEFIQAVVLSAAEKCIAFGVDEVLNEQEVLVKGLGKQLSRVRNIAGATILGTGKVVPILNVPDLMKSAVKVTAVPARAAVAAEEVKAKRKSILVVEDSITARTLLKNILGAAGYNVKTAVDGIDAFTILKTEDFDLVVSDIDMPRMNGFDLTSKIRADKKLSELPVVLVTALESREDKERGIDVGANAYIVKSSFDQSNLLETIKRLI